MTEANLRKKVPDAVVLGLSPTGLYAIRELGRAGLIVGAVGETRQTAAASRYVSMLITQTDPLKRLDRMIREWGDETRKPVLIPTSDQDIEFIMTHQSALVAVFEFQGSYKDGLADDILTKETFYKICKARNIAYPGLWEGDAHSLAGKASDINFPCMLKPSRIHDIKAQMAGKKGWIVESAAELPQILKQIPDNAGTLLCQEIVPGSESEITLFCAYFDKDGGIHQPFTARKLRQYPPGFGSAATVQSADEQESREIACALLKDIGYTGIAAAEFKRDPRTGTLKIIEINPRPSLWFSISSAAGKQITLSAYSDLSGRIAPPPEVPQTNGVRWQYRGKDLYAAIFYALSKRFILPAPDLNAVGPALQKVAPVFEQDDPKPAVAEIGSLLRKGFARIRRKLHV